MSTIVDVRRLKVKHYQSVPMPLSVHKIKYYQSVPVSVHTIKH